MLHAEGEALEIYRRAGADPESPPSPEQLARQILGADAVVEHWGLRAPAMWCAARDQLWLNPRLPPRRRAWVVAHELAERHLAHLHFRSEEIEQFADRIAAALIAPAPAMRIALRMVDQHLPSLAEAFDTSESIAGLRIGEVTGIPVALVKPSRIHVRGEAWTWPDESTLRRWALSSGHGATEKISRMKISDAPRRVLLVAS